MSMNKLVELLTHNIIQRGGGDKDNEESNGFKGFLYHLFLWKPIIQFGTYIKNISWIIIFIYLLANIVIYAFVGFIVYLFYYVAFVGYPKWLVDLLSFSISNVIEVDKLLEDNNLLYNSLNVLRTGKSINNQNMSPITAYNVYNYVYNDTGNSTFLKSNVTNLDTFINSNYSKYGEKKKYTVALREFYLFYYKLYDKDNVRNLSATNSDSIERIIDSTNNSSDITQPITINGKTQSIQHFQFYKTHTDYKIYNKEITITQTTGKGNKSPDQCIWEVYLEDKTNNFAEYELKKSIKETNDNIRKNLEDIYNIISANNYIPYLVLPSSQNDIDNFISDYPKYLEYQRNQENQTDTSIEINQKNNENQTDTSIEINEYSWFIIEALKYNANNNIYNELTNKLPTELTQYSDIETLQTDIYDTFKKSSIYSSFSQSLQDIINNLQNDKDNFDDHLNKITNILHVHISKEGLYNSNFITVDANVEVNFNGIKPVVNVDKPVVNTTTTPFNDTGSYLDLLSQVENTIKQIIHRKAISYYINLSQKERNVVFNTDSFKLNISKNTDTLINQNPIFSHIYFNQNIDKNKKPDYYKKIMDLYIYLMSSGSPTTMSSGSPTTINTTNPLPVFSESELRDFINNLSNIGGDYKDFVNSINIANLYFNTYFYDINQMVQKPYTTTEGFFYNLWTPFYQDIIMNRIVNAFSKCFKDSWSGDAFVNKRALEPHNYVNYIYKYTFIQDTMTTVVKNTWSRLFTSSTITPPAAPEEVSLET